MKQQESDSKILRIIYLTKIAVLFTGAAILFHACENNLEQIKAFASTENLPVVEAYNFETLYTDSGEVRFFLKAPKLLQFEDEGVTYVEFPQGIELIRYDKNQNIISSITADYAKNFVREEKWEAKNNVVATNAQGDTLKTEHLIWEEKTERIHTKEFVRIIRPDQIITGIGFESDQSLQNWRINNPRGTIYLEMDDTPQSSNNLPNPANKDIVQSPDQQILNFGN
jgi:LPS export ABC transporter protein LptC